jgi:hypothetical protein
MSVGLEGPAPYYQPPPDDRATMTLSDHLRAALAMIAQDRVLAEDEKQEVALFIAGVTEIGQQRAAAAAPQVSPGDGLFEAGEQEDFNAGAGEPAGEEALAGVEPY